jgi:peptide deformylase
VVEWLENVDWVAVRGTIQPWARPAARVAVVVLGAAVAIVLAQAGWSALTARPEFTLAARLSREPCMHITRDQWRNGTVLARSLPSLQAALERTVRRDRLGGLAAPHLGVPICALRLAAGARGQPGATMLNARLTGEGATQVRTREHSVLCPGQDADVVRYESIRVTHNDPEDFEEWSQVWRGPQAHTLQALLEAQRGQDHCRR